VHRCFPTPPAGGSAGPAAALVNDGWGRDSEQRWQRVARGQAQLAADLFHQHLLAGVGVNAALPQAWRSPRQWAELVRCGVVDAVLVQRGQGKQTLPGSRGADQPLPGSLACVDLGCRPLVLACNPPAAGGQRHPIPPLQLLAPPRAAAMELHQALEGMQLAPLMSFGSTRATEWIAALEQGGALVPVPAELLLQPPWHQAQLTAVPPWEPLWEQLDLLVHRSLLGGPGLQLLVEELRRRIEGWQCAQQTTVSSADGKG